MRSPKHWQDGVNAALGLWLMLSPWALGFQGMSMAMSNAIVMGLALVAVALGAMLLPQAWEEWSEGALGLWLMASPWLLGFGWQRDAMLSTSLTGLLVLVLALWTLASDPDYNAWLGKRLSRVRT
ncbi:SPW repeat protein [uncultured Ramlibacter sp.]|uniref:SPW repeat protein n=1 Tax=uncultured Ramlibacter sp. TaxID=260755 RepID=UPI0026172936|nr:SPW repeat protein [uncultured Ramlibacter sp.]